MKRFPNFHQTYTGSTLPIQHGLQYKLPELVLPEPVLPVPQQLHLTEEDVEDFLPSAEDLVSTLLYFSSSVNKLERLSFKPSLTSARSLPL
jgi:hypothetical protein